MTKPLHITWLLGKWRQSILLLSIALMTLTAYGQKSVDCGASCFKTEITSLKQLDAGCLVYELQVSYEADCKNALSHFSLEMGCGVFSNATNSESWPMELNQTDPTSGLTGLKVDEIQEFGDESPLKTFTVTFTFCPTDCEDGESCFDPHVAYKAGQCLYKEVVDAQCILPLEVSASSTDLSCANTNDGSISLQISGGTEPYEVIWEHGATGTELLEVGPGTYAYSVVSADGQTLAGEIIVDSPESLFLESTVNQPACGTDDGGTVSLSVLGGVAPYTIKWNDGAVGADRSNLSPGLYNVTVSDATGCSLTERFIISGQSGIGVVANMSQPACGAITASIDVSVSGGQSPYSFEWSDGSTLEDRTGLAAGLYTLKVTDATGCHAEKTYEVNVASQLSLSANLIHPTCKLSDGSIEVVVEGGTAPYTYEWRHGANEANLAGLAAGSYLVTVTDANGCQNMASYSLVPQTNLFLSAKASSTNCQNEPLGAIDLTVFGGNGPFTYQWDNGETTEDISALVEGTYKVTVTDAIGCSATLSQEVKRKTFVVFDKTNHKVCNTPGSIDLTVYYAVEPIQYEWSNGSVTQDINGLAAGQYSVTITDGSGCQVVRNYTIYDSNNLGLEFNATTEGCGEQVIYSLEGAAVGGAAPFNYLWSNGSTSSILQNVQPGTYELTISDANGCSRTSSYTIDAQTGVSDCLIQADVTALTCGSSGNSMSTDVQDAQSYQWVVTSTDGLWTIDSGSDASQISFTAGGVGSTATFSLELVTASGCVATCSYEVSSCTILTTDNGTSGDGSTNDGTTGDGTGTDGTSGDGSTNDGTTDGSSGDGTSGDGTSGDGSTNDSTTGDGTGTDGTGGNGSTNDGTTDGSSGDGTSGDGTSGDGSTNDDTNGNDGSCTDCFEAEVVQATLQGEVYNYTIKISSDLSCNFDLSNLVIAIPECAVLESYSNSKGWKMVVVRNDKNTGLSGIKVDDIPGFGKDPGFTEFTVSLSLRALDKNCQDALSCWSPEVAFKAGQCIINELVAESCIVQTLSLKAYPNPTSGTFMISTDSLVPGERYSVELYDTQGNLLKSFSRLEVADIEQLKITLDNINTSFLYLKVSDSIGSTWATKVMVSQ